MKTFTRQEFEKEKGDLYEQIINGAVFIYPTDTVYGIGCNAKNSDAVKKIRRLKERADSPFSIIAPSKKWIENCCDVDDSAKDWVSKLPAPLTLILNKKGSCVSEHVSPNSGSLGVRMVGNWFQKHVESLDVPIITTSVNKHGEAFMTSLEDLDPQIGKGVDFIIYEGEKKGRPSKLVDLSDKFKIIER